MKSATQAILLLVFTGNSVAHADIVFSDSLFADADWSQEVILDTTNGSPVSIDQAAQVATGGNPDEYRSSEVTIHTTGASSQAFIVAHTKDSAIFDPSVSGAIASIGFSIDNKLFSQVGGSPGLLHSALLFQDAKHYVAPIDFLDTDWGTLTATLDATDFGETSFSGGVDVNSNPDFSSSGSSILFGYAESSATSGNTNITTISGADNWSVSVTSVPEPSSLVMLSLSGLCCVYRRTRRRSKA